MAASPSPVTHAVLEAAEANLARRRAGFQELLLAREWALLHLVDLDEFPDPRCRPTPLGALELPVEEYASAELAVSLQVHPLSARHLMADAVDIAARLPHVWAALEEARMDAWVARKIASATSDLTDDRALWVDAVVADLLGSLPTGRLLRVVEARVVEADQALADAKAEAAAARRNVWLGQENDHGVRPLLARGDAAAMTQLFATTDHLARLLRAHCAGNEAKSIDELRAEAIGLLANPLAALKLLIGANDADQHDRPDADDVPDAVARAIAQAPPERTRPRAVVYLHLRPSALEGRGVTRAEELGVLTRRQLVDVLGHHHITLRPVIDLNSEMAADCYEVPAAIAEQLRLARPADAFPYGESPSRKQEQDHTVPYRPHGPPGQTRLSNLGHLIRSHHRVKTHGKGWHVAQHEGQFTWITPHGRVLLTDGYGTHQALDRSRMSQLEQRLHAVLGAA